MRKTKEDKRINAEVDAMFKKLAFGVQFNIMDLGNVLDAGRNAAKKGESVETAMQQAIAKYRKN